MKNMFKILSPVFSTCLPVGTACHLLLSATPTHAIETGVSINGKTSFTGYNGYVSAILGYSIKLGFALAALMLIYAGIKYLTSQGNQTQINDAKEIIFGAIIGFSILLLIDVILRFLGIATK